MSESVRDLLTRGVAAAKANDKDEARFFLEWVLRNPDSSMDDQAKAWLWLSQIRDAPTEKRECLENVLAIDPQNPLARRGLAILDGKLKPEDVVDPHAAAQPVAPAPAPPSADVKRYVCPKCGGKLSFAADKRALTCNYCGHQLWEYEAIQEGALVREQDFAATLPTAQAHRWQLASARTLACQSCGATITLPPVNIAAACPFCGSAHVITATESRELIRPEGVLPFQFDAKMATQHIRRWLDKQRFRPDDLDKRSAITNLHGVYLPFWTFDLGGEVKWHALVEEGSGNSRNWVPRNGGDIVYANDLLVAGSHSLPKDLIDRLTDFDTSALVPYSTDALADWSAEIYQVTLSDASLVARRRALDESKEHIRDRTLGSENVRDLTFNSLGVIVESFKLVLLPVWVSSYTYKGRRYPLIANGQTGKVAGNVPRSGFQKLMAGLFGGD